jgi:hypothetical protein
MKKFILKLVFFLLPLLVLFVELILPLNAFTYRPWEALIYKSKESSAFPFYPNQSLVMHSMGDLCHHSPNEIVKFENWITDEIGYRNDKFIKRADVLLIGDSFIAGSALSQDSTITAQLGKKGNMLVYNMAPSSFSEFVSLMNQGVIDKPNWIVYEIVERNIPEPLNAEVADYDRFCGSLGSIVLDKIKRKYLVKYVNSRILQQTGYGTKGKESEMYFLNGMNQRYLYDEVNEIAETVAQYKSYCDSIGVKFIFLPIPNKETIYYEQVPLDYQPNYIAKLDSALEQRGVVSINTQEIFNAQRDHKLLYHLDDTHWNAAGVEIVVNELIEKVLAHDVVDGKQ